MRLPLSYFQKSKTLAHIAQAVLIVIVWCLTIAVFRDGGPTDGRTAWYFAVCWLSIPALIYQTMVPAWTRAQRFSNPIAFLAVDAVFSILWFSAFVAVATWNSAGIDKGAEKAKDKKGNGCATFGFGSETTCKISKTTAGFGALISVLFALATAMSFYAFRYHRKNGFMPGARAAQDHVAMQDQTKDAFSSAPDSDEAYGGHPGYTRDEEYARLRDEEDGSAHPGQRVAWGREGERVHDYEDTAYGGAYEGRRQDPFDDQATEAPPRYDDAGGRGNRGQMF
ncbi:MAG: hypothetical protein M1814_006221 [Vezdaea aestivalis]|nr:MAG: hypothetical protein M1814_006221 [Vezdaea aestivalis]